MTALEQIKAGFVAALDTCHELFVGRFTGGKLRAVLEALMVE